MSVNPLDATSLLSAALMPNRSQEFVLQEIISVLQKLNCGSINMASIKSFARVLPTKVLYLLTIILFHHYVGNTKDMVHGLKSLLWRLVSSAIYRVKRYTRGDSHTLSHYQGEAFSNSGQDATYTFGIPMFIETNNRPINQTRNESTQQTTVEVQYIPFIHRHLINRMEEEGQRQFNEVEGTSNYYPYSHEAYRSQNYGELYSSSNYVRLRNIIHDHVDVESTSHHYNNLGILINGRSGLGKSRFAEYLASTGIVENIYHVDLNNDYFMNKEPKTLFRIIFTDIAVTKTSLFMIDEMDKWLAFYIDRSYSRLLESAAKAQAKTTPTSVESNRPDAVYVPPKHEHERCVKRDFLLALLSVLERKDIHNSCIVIFCCNNFHTIFQDVDITHHQSLQDRFMHVEFVPCDRAEIMGFLQHHNSKFITAERTARFHRPDIHDIVSQINSDVCITYRDLTKLCTMMGYNYANIVVALNKNHRGSLLDDSQMDHKYITNDSKLAASSQILSKNLMSESKSPAASSKSPAASSGSINSLNSSLASYEHPISNDTILSDSTSNAVISEDSTLCDICGENPSSKELEGINFCTNCNDERGLYCWLCSSTTDIIYVLSPIVCYDEQEDMPNVCTTCLPAAQKRWPSYITHVYVNCQCATESSYRPIAPDRKAYNLCAYCNGVDDEQCWDSHMCEMCSKCLDDGGYYCPAIKSNVCQACVGPYPDRREVLPKVDVEIEPGKIAYTKKLEKQIKPIELPAPAKCDRLVIIKCLTCDIYSVDQDVLFCECLDCRRDITINNSVTKHSEDLEINLQHWNRCAHCIHKRPKPPIVQIVDTGKSRDTIRSNLSNIINKLNDYLDQMHQVSDKSPEFGRIVIEAMAYCLLPTNLQAIAMSAQAQLMVMQFPILLIEGKDYVIIGQYRNYVQSTLQIGWPDKSV